MLIDNVIRTRDVIRICHMIQLGDCPNVETKTMNKKKMWITINERNGWELQKNKLTHHVRILDSNNIRKAWGTLSVMQDKFERLTREEFLVHGDVIGVSRKIGVKIYDHYAVYIGNDKVIHYAAENGDFNGKPTIHEAPIGEFLRGSKHYFVLHFDKAGKGPFKIQSKTSFVLDDFVVANSIKLENMNGYRLYSADETVKRAKSRMIEEQEKGRKYNLITNNCEHFAIWCKTGIHTSRQVQNVFDILINTLPYGPMVKKFKLNQK